MDIELRRDSEIPIGVQLGWALRARILGGTVAPGARLPGVRDMAVSTGVNINTIRSVYAKLEADGLLSSEQGRGTFVADTVPVDERLAAVTRRALEEAGKAGLDPREVAAALFGRLGAEPEPPAEVHAVAPASRRRALRSEIAALERELADARLARALRDAGTEARRPTGGRLLGEDELRALRDELASRLAAMHAPEPGPPEPAPASSPSARSATRPGVAVRLVFGA